MITSKQHFLDYCKEQIKSIEIAIRRKANGSTIEAGYFNEHINKLSTFFNDYNVQEQ